MNLLACGGSCCLLWLPDVLTVCPLLFAGGSESGDEPAPSAAVDNSAVEGASGKEEKSELAALADGSARVSFANWSPQQAAPQQQEVAPQQQPQQQQQAIPMTPVGCGAGAAPRQHPMPGGGAPAPPRSPSALAAAWGGVPSDAAVPPAVGMHWHPTGWAGRCIHASP